MTSTKVTFHAVSVRCDDCGFDHNKSTTTSGVGCIIDFFESLPVLLLIAVETESSNSSFIVGMLFRKCPRCHTGKLKRGGWSFTQMRIKGVCNECVSATLAKTAANKKQKQSAMVLLATSKQLNAHWLTQVPLVLGLGIGCGEAMLCDGCNNSLAPNAAFSSGTHAGFDFCRTCYHVRYSCEYVKNTKSATLLAHALMYSLAGA